MTNFKTILLKHRVNNEYVKIMLKDSTDEEDFKLTHFELLDRKMNMVNSFTCKTDENNLEKIIAVTEGHNWKLDKK